MRPAFRPSHAPLRALPAPRIAVALGVIATSGACVSPAVAADRAPLSSVEVRGASCLRSAELVALVGTALGRDRFDETLEVRVVETPGPGAEISFFREGTLLGQRSFRSEGASCIEVETAVALLVAIGIEANSEPAAARLPDDGPPSEGPERRSILASLRSTSLSTEARSDQQVTPHVAAGFAEGVLPGTTLTLSLGLDWRVVGGRPWATDLRFNAVIPAEPVSFDGPLSGLVAIETAVCFKRDATFVLCGGVLGGAFQWAEPVSEVVRRVAWVGLSATAELHSPRWHGLYALARISPEICFTPRPGLSHFAFLGLAGLGFEY